MLKHNFLISIIVILVFIALPVHVQADSPVLEFVFRPSSLLDWLQMKGDEYQILSQITAIQMQLPSGKKEGVDSLLCRVETPLKLPQIIAWLEENNVKFNEKKPGIWIKDHFALVTRDKTGIVLAGKKGISQMSKPGFAFSPLDSFAPETAMIGFNWQRPADEITLNEDSPLPAQMMQLAATISFWLKKEGFQLEMTGLGKEAEKMGWRLKEFIKMIPASSENDTSLFAKVIQLAKGAKVVIRQGRCLIESTDSQELQKVIHQLLQQQFTEQEVVITEEIRNNRSLLCQGNQELIRIASAVRQREDSNLKPIKDVVELIKDGLLKYLPECPDGGQYSVEVVDSILQVKCSFHQGDLK